MRNEAIRRVGVFVAGVFFAAGGAAFGASAARAALSVDFVPTTRGCEDGQGVVTTVPLGSKEGRLRYQVVVYSSSRFTSLKDVREDLARQGLTPQLVVNGGYFGDGHPLSFFKSAHFNHQLQDVSHLIPRTCMIYRANARRVEFAHGDPAFFARMRNTPGVEVACGGPRLVMNGTNVSERYWCQEKFKAACRRGMDRGRPKDPISFKTGLPRTAACTTKNGDLKFFSFLSPSERCGISGGDLAQRMTAEGCVDGMNFDGGTSSSLFIAGPKPEDDYVVQVKDSITLPVWIVVVDAGP